MATPAKELQNSNLNPLLSYFLQNPANPLLFPFTDPTHTRLPPPPGTALMAHVSDLPCDGDGVCMLCKQTPAEEEKHICSTCATPWHMPCLSKPPSLSALPDWQCPDCSPPESGDRPPAPAAGVLGVPSELITAVRAIEADGSLTDREKARRRQELMCGGAARSAAAVDGGDKPKAAGQNQSRKNDLLGLLDESLMCSFCMQLPERPVTTPCGHNFCLACFQKWIAIGKRTCGKCRSPIPSHMTSQPRINSTLVAAIRVAKTAKTVTSSAEFPLKVYHFIHNQDRPDQAFTTERAQRAGKANACSGKIFVTVPPDHFGPILAENDPIRNQGVLVGESWEDRMECRQWGAHLPHVAGIAGQSDYGAQSVALSGGYKDDEDHGEWFLYTGSGGRDLSGNKRTNKEQSFDQQFNKMNEALRVSCIKGYPVRVVRSHKEKRSSYAPETGVRYDGIYRIEKCWRKVGLQGFKVCRYLFIRCDNEPAPWTSDENGDRPRPLPHVQELKNAIDITERKGSPAWDYDEKDGWRWVKPPPPSRKPVAISNPEDQKRARKVIRRANNISARQKLLKEFSCLICRKVMNLPLTTPCAHNFCKPCLEGVFTGQTFVRERIHTGGKSLRVQKNVMKCPCCPNDISYFLQNPQVNRELMDVIENLKRQTEENAESSEDEINGTPRKLDPVDEETKVVPTMLETSNEVIEMTKFATNDSKHSPAHKQNGIVLGSESNVTCPQNTQTLQSSNEDDQISIAGSKQSLTCKGKKIKDEKKVTDSKESNGIGSKNIQVIDRSGKDCDVSLKQSTRPITRSQKKLESSSKANQSNKLDSENLNSIGEDFGDCQVQSTDNKQPVIHGCKKRGNEKTNSSKKSNEVDGYDVEVANGSREDLTIPQGKQTVMHKNKSKDGKKVRKKCDELDSVNRAVLDEGEMDCPTTENKHPRTLMRRPITRSSAKMNREEVIKSEESTDVEMAMNSKGSKGVKKAKASKYSTDVRKAVESKRSDSPSSGNPEMLNGGDKDQQTPKSKQPNVFVRKRPFTRSCASKVKEKNAKRSKNSSKVQKSGNSPSSPLHVFSDDDDDFE